MGLRDEIADDPLGRGYSSMTDAQVLADLSTKYRTRSRNLIPSHEVLSALEDADLSSLSVVVHRKFQHFMAVGELDISNPRIRGALAEHFSGRAGALSRLQGLETKAITRAEDLELGRLRLGHIQVART